MKHISSHAESKTAEADFHELEKLAELEPTPDRVATKLAKLMRVQRTEVAFLRVEEGLLRFLYPAELRTAGAIPVSSNAVAARTVVTRTSLLSNNFVSIKHATLFESVKLRDSEEKNEKENPAPIQKLISVPIQSADCPKVLGVVQISRKGVDANAAGPDFTNEELRLLERAAEVLARMGFMNDSGSSAAAAR